MAKLDDIGRLLQAAGAFVAGGQPPEMVAAAEARLGVSFPVSFRDYLLRWGSLSFNGYEYYGLTRNADFDNSGVPNCVWFTLRKRAAVELPPSLVVIRNDNDDEYVCIDTDQPVRDGDCRIVIWDNMERAISETLPIGFLDLLRDELEEFVEGG